MLTLHDTVESQLPNLHTQTTHKHPSIHPPTHKTQLYDTNLLKITID